MANTSLIAASTGVMALGWFAFVAFFVFLVARWRHMSPFRLSTPGIAFCTYLFLLLLPALFLASDQADEVAASRYIIANVLSGIGMILGMVVVNMLYRPPRIDSLQYVRAPLLIPTSDSWFSIIGVLAGAVVVAAILRFAMTGRIPLVEMFLKMHQYGALKESRFALKEIGWQAGVFTRLQLYYITWAVWVVAPIVAVAIQAKHQATQRSVWRLFFYAWILFCLVLAMWDINKIAAAQMASMIVAGTILIRGRLSWKLVLVGCGILMTPALMSVALHPEHISLPRILEALVGRAFVAPSQIVYYYIEVIPGQVPHTWGAGTFVLGTLLGRAYVNVPNEVAMIVLGDMHTITHMNCGFIGAGWAEGGYVGVMLYSVIAGLASQCIHNYIMCKSVHGKKLHLVALQAIQVPLWTIVFASVNFPQLFAGRGMVFALVLCWWLGARWYKVAPLRTPIPQGRYTRVGGSYSNAR